MDEAKKRILIVDDEPDFTLMMGLTLEQTGRYETRQENDATRTVDAARAFDPDLILLDVMMPDIDVGDVLTQLKSDPATRHIPVIFLTALVGGGSDVTPAGMDSGGRHFMPKPVDVPALTERIDQILAAEG